MFFDAEFRATDGQAGDLFCGLYRVGSAGTAAHVRRSFAVPKQPSPAVYR